MKSDENVLGKGIEAIFEKTAHRRKGGEKTLELPNGVIRREGDELIITLNLGEDDDIRGAVEELAEAAKTGMLDTLVDTEKLKKRFKDRIEMAQMAFEDGDIPAALDEYKEALKSFEKTYRNLCREHQIDYQLMGTDQSLDVALMEFLIKRQKLG